MLSAEVWQQSQQQAAQAVYKTWWEEADSSTEEQRLEMVRLGLLAQNQEIAVTVGDAVANRWVNESRFVEAQDLCQEIMAVFQDYRILGTVARAEAVLGQVNEALAHYRQALAACPEDASVRQSATLGNMAGVIADQGEIEQALQLWNQSLELYERIGDVQGKAATLAWIAYIAGETGDKARQLTLNLQAAQALGQVRAYVDLVTVLGNLGTTAESNARVYLAQAIWLCLRIQAPLVSTLNRISRLFNAVPQGDVLEMLLAATALWFCNVRGEGHPQIAQLQEDSFKLLVIAAETQGIQIEEALEAWFIQQQLNDPNFFVPQLNQRLEEMIGDGWLFDPNAVGR